jgi:hypothetical protein
MIASKRILFFSPTVYPGFEFSDLNLFNKIKAFGYQIDFSVKSNLMFQKKLKLKLKKFTDDTCSFYGYAEKLKKNKIFIKNNVIWIERWSFLKELIKKYDVIVIGSFRDSNWIIQYIRNLNKIAIVVSSPPNLDFSGLMPNLYCAVNVQHVNYLRSYLNKKKITKFFVNDQIIPTGSSYHDFDNKYYISKKNFFKKYKINNYFFLFMPSAGHHHKKYYQMLYKQICGTVSNKYKLLIKLHPSELQNRKNFYYINSNSQKKNAKYIKAINPRDYLFSLIYCKSIISIYSTSFMDANYFKTPIIYVNRYKSIYSLYFNKNYPFEINSKKTLLKINKYKFNKFFINYIKTHERKDMYNTLINDPSLNFSGFNFYGADTTIDNLNSFLKKIKRTNASINFNKNNDIITKNIIYFLNNYKKPNYFHNKLKIYILKLSNIINLMPYYFFKIIK